MDLRQASGTGAGSGPTIVIGPVLDSAGVEYTGLVIGDITISKNGTEAAMAANATLTHVSNGYYSLVMIGNNVDTLGRLKLRCNKSTYQFAPLEFMVLPASVWDALYANAAGGANGLPLSKANNIVDANLISVGPTGDNTAQTKVDLAATIALRLLEASYTAPDNIGIGNAASSAASAASSAAIAATQSTTAATQSTAAASSSAAAVTAIGLVATAVNAIGVIVTAIQVIVNKLGTMLVDATTPGNSTFTEEAFENHEAIPLTAQDIEDIAEAVVTDIQAIPGFTVEVVSPTDTNGEMEVRQGDSYLVANSRNLAIALSGSLPLLETACSLKVFFGGTVTTYTGTITVNTSTSYTLKFDLTGTQTAAMPVGTFSYEAEVTYQGTSNKWTPSTGIFTVLPQL